MDGIPSSTGLKKVGSTFLLRPVLKLKIGTVSPEATQVKVMVSPTIGVGFETVKEVMEAIFRVSSPDVTVDP